MSIRETADTFSHQKSPGQSLTKLQDKRVVNMTPKIAWFERTFTKTLEEELVGHM